MNCVGLNQDAPDCTSSHQATLPHMNHARPVLRGSRSVPHHLCRATPTVLAEIEDLQQPAASRHATMSASSRGAD